MKKQKVKKGFLWFISLLLIVVTAACGKSSGSESAEADGETNFSYMMAAKYTDWLKDLKWYPEMLKRTGANVELVEGGKDDGDYYKNLDLKIGSGEFADSGIVTLSQAEVYGSQGAFLDLKPLIEEHAPNIQKFMDENPDYEKLVTSSGGEIFGLMQEYPAVSYVTFYRSDLFEKAGIKEAPKTIDEFTATLQKLKDANKNVENFYPFTGRDGYIKFTQSFGAMDHIDENGKVHGIYKNGLGFDLKSEGFKQLVEQYNAWYKAGLIDPEWVAGVATEESWQTKMLNGKGAISNDFFTRPSWFMNNGGPENDPNFSMAVMNPFLDLNGQQTKVPYYEPQYRMDRVFVVNSNAENKGEEIIKFMDYVFSEEGRTLMNYGVEGESFQANGDQKEFLVKFEEEGNQPIGTPVWNFLQDRLTFPGPVNNDAYYQWMDELTQSFAKQLFDQYTESYPMIKYSTEQLEQRSTLLARVENEVSANLVKFVTGKRSMSEWDQFLNEMDQAGYSKVVEIDQAALDAMN